MVTAYIVSTGTELLMGSTSDTNSIFLSRQLIELGIKVQGKIVVGDDAGDIKRAFEYGLSAADMVISSGGLGPTNDDLTKEMACEVMDCQAVLIDEELERVKNYFIKRGRPMPESNIKQAMFPPGAVILRNKRGTAPGMYLRQKAKLIVLLPGPPHEMKSMYFNEVEPRLADEYALWDKSYACRTIKVFGPGESQVEVMLGELIERPQGYSMALTAKSGEIHIGIQVYGKDINECPKKLDEITNRVREKLGNNIFGVDEDTMLDITASSLKRQNKRIALAESCTGGLLAKMLTDLPGSSDYFWGGVTAYNDEAKQLMLGVKEETLDKYGAVSFETAEEMVRGLVNISGTDVGVSITGIAGPSGGSDDKPVGLVYIGVICDGVYNVKELRFGGQRDMIRVLAARTALDMVRRILNAQEGK
ncbi:c-terminal domain of cina type s [hydrocarbon metagenome]|uniref:C-terminal domain of cina type s n=1 Tax=hydrocarbon metagenome TaxID=938273 RepID=A0A0W8E5V9_9ZZZZ